MKLKFYILLILFPSALLCQTTSISGVINSYAGVTAIGSQSVTVTSSSGFSVNDRVLLIQMKGATINTANNNSFGTILNYNDAGNYEFATISSISGTNITFGMPVSRTYTSSGFVQLIKVPTYNNVNITGLLTCSAWNGTTGGVLVFEASGSITFNADVDVSGNGFLGGVLSNGAITGCAADTSDYVLPSTTLAAARKGEGIVNPNLLMADGKGAWANGGGSGNDCNGGGAGGGNAGLGGHGGDSKVNVSCPPFFYQYSGGNPGKKMLYSNTANKIFLGGGGGCGHQNDGAGSAGVSGGAIVIIRAASVTGNSHSIKTNGTDNSVVAGIDGQGGGGAGGTVLLDVCTVNSLTIFAKGGKGGVDNFGGSDCHGKGGGGGGGMIWASSPSALSGITFSLIGGLPGVFTNSSSLCYGNSNGATAGQSGDTLSGLVIPGTSPMVGNGVVTDTAICLSNTIQLTAPTSASYTWSNGSNAQTITASTSGIYWVEIPLANGCPVSDTFKVHLITASQYNILKDTTLCNVNSYTLNAAAALSYTWSNGSHNSSLTVNTTGVYWVDMQIDQCVIRDSAILTFINLPGILKDTFLCKINQVTLPFSTGSASSYHWSTGAITSTISVTNGGIYWVDMQVGQCVQRDSFNVSFFNWLNFLQDSMVCTPSYSLSIPSLNNAGYHWSTGDTTSSITVNTDGIYWVDVILNQCILRDSTKIHFLHPPVIHVTADTFICLTPIILEVKNPQGVITWPDGSHQSQLSAFNVGTYYVSLADSGCVTTLGISVRQIPDFNSLLVPTIFTPNADGLNDFFELNNSDWSIENFSIYNRWGKLVYSVANNDVKWDGKQNKDFMDDGTYFWVGTFNNPCNRIKKSDTRKGFITLLK